MRKLFMGMICALLIAAAAFAEVDIPQEKRVKNFPSGCCVWCAVENLGNAHGITQLKGIAKYRHDNYGSVKIWVEGSYVIDQWGNWTQIEGPHWSTTNEAPGTPDRVREEFKRLKVTYKMQTHHNFDKAILKEAIDKKLGCAVGLKDYPCQNCYHMVTMTELTDDKFIFVDNNGKCERIEKTREWFDSHWTGYAIMVYPPKPKVTVKKDEVKKPEVKEDSRKD